MQMVARNTLPERFLYYWARLYSQQLLRGDGYHQLCPTISICFVNGRLFPEGEAYHRPFFSGPRHGD
jgi:predicted transposase/invertase (TIGR01784 family)